MVVSAAGGRESKLRDSVALKGSRRGLRVVLDESADFREVLAALRRRLWPARRFFAGAPVFLEAGRRQATWAEWSEVIRTLRECGLEVRDGAPEGALAASGALPSNHDREAGSGAQAVVGSARLASEIAQLGLEATGRGLERAVPPDRTLLVHRTLRSGQRVAYDGHVVVVGDVNPGAEVIASGDIVVMGALRGIAHAGARGDEGAVVVALRLDPLQLRIAHRVARSPDQTVPGRGPEMARIRDGAVEVQPYTAGVEEGTSAWQGAS
ncbi:MAG: septum site-determining protein MinC [Bacillota bacterium]